MLGELFALQRENEKLETENAKLRDALIIYAHQGGQHTVEVNGKQHVLKEFGCGCCAWSYDLDSDGTAGTSNMELDDVQGWAAREALKR